MEKKCPRGNNMLQQMTDRGANCFIGTQIWSKIVRTAEFGTFEMLPKIREIFFAFIELRTQTTSLPSPQSLETRWSIRKYEKG